MVAAASPPPAPAPTPHAAPVRAHPTYTKMITQALTELGGCSPRPAIAGYIIGRFSGLPACHDLLLSAHLRRLLADGVLRAHGQDDYIFAPPEQDRTPAVRPGPGRPRKTPLLPAKRKRATEDEDADDPVTKRGPTTHEIRAEAAGGQEASTTFQNGAVQSGGAKRGRGRPRKLNPPPAAAKRGRGRPRKHKPPEAAASSPTTGAAASRGFKTGCGRPSMDRPTPVSAAEASMDKSTSSSPTAAAEAPAAPGTEAGNGQSRMENLAAAMSGEGTKRGRGRPRKEKPPAPAPAAAAGAGVKRSCGKEPSIRPGRVESPYAAFFRHMMAQLEEDSVSGETTTTTQEAEMGVPTGGGKETRAAAGRLPVSGQNAAPVPAGATHPDLDPANLADDAASTGIKTPRGRPRKNKPSAAAADDDDCVSTGVKRGRVRRRTEKLEEAMSAPETGDAAPPTEVKRGRGRPRKERLEEGMSAETGDAVPPTGVKRGRVRPRKERLEEGMSAETGDAVPPTGVKRGPGRPRKKRGGGGRPRKDLSSGTAFAEATGEALFRDMAEAPGDFGEDRD